METDRIRKILKTDSFTSGVFRGVFPIDKTPAPNNYPCAYVFNTDASDQPGEHWIAIYLTDAGKGEYFDSYGIPPLQYKFLAFLRKHSSTWTHNETNLQASVSDVCGEYCVFFLLQRCRGRSLASIVNMFNPKRVEDNDLLVYNIIHNRINDYN